MDADDLRNRFMFHPADTNEKRRLHEDIRKTCYAVALNLNSMLPDGREKNLALTHLEQVMFWANAGAARDGA